MTFLNREEQIGWPPVWHQGQLPKLWQYNLHYFDDLWALEYERAKTLVLDWIEKNPLSRHVGVAWDPYVISLRLQNWVGFFLGRERLRVEQDAEFVTTLWTSIFLQTQCLRRNLEFHLLGNHLLENAAALAMVGSCFAGQAAGRWYKVGKGLLERELAEQILEDGGHIERSPMYQDRVAFLIAMLFNCGDESIRRLVKGPLKAVLSVSQKLRLGDGKIALLNDSASGIYRSYDETSRFAKAAGLSEPEAEGRDFFALPQMGYFGWRSEDGTGIVCDAGRIGPDYVPGHAHGDFFSFELCHKGRRVIVDSGVHDYVIGPMRRYCRSTAAHSTVEIDGQDQCEFWGAFRVARRGRPRDVRWDTFEDGFRLSGWHDGYCRLPGKPTHSRDLRWWKDSVLVVRDRVCSGRSHRLVSRLHLHPDSKIVAQRGRQTEIATAAGKMTVVVDGPLDIAVESGWYCPEFGVKIEKQVLAFSGLGSDVVCGFCCVIEGNDVEYSITEGAVVDGRQYRL